MPSPSTIVVSAVADVRLAAPRASEEGWNETPIVGLESIPIMTTSSPAETCGSIVAATVFAIRRQ